jgi:hypothetical protein
MVCDALSVKRGWDGLGCEAGADPSLIFRVKASVYFEVRE